MNQNDNNTAIIEMTPPVFQLCEFVKYRTYKRPISTVRKAVAVVRTSKVLGVIVEE